MSSPRLYLRGACLCLAIMVSVNVGAATAQNSTVTPNTPSVEKDPNTSGLSGTYQVRNNLGTASSFTFLCTKTGNITCGTVVPSFATIQGFQTITVTVNYSTGAAGSGSVILTAYGGSGTSNPGTMNVTIKNESPILSTAKTEVRYRDVGKCLQACFDAAYQRSTVSYVSTGVARALTFTYNSSTQKPTPVVSVDVSRSAGRAAPTSYIIQLQRPAAGNVYVNLLNGTQSAYFTLAGTSPTRLTAAFEALTANSMAAGAHPITIKVTANYPGGPQVSNISSVVVVNDQSGGPFGAGVSLGGVQRLYLLNSRAAIAEGDGSMADYGTSPYTTPAGTSASLSYNAGSQIYTRSYLDGSRVEFNSTGRMLRAIGLFGDTTKVQYVTGDTLIAAIVDPTGHVDSLCYSAACGTTGNGKIYSARVLTGAAQRVHLFTTDGSGRLIRFQDPDGLSDSLAYGANGLLASTWDRARKRADLTYDTMNRLATVTGPTIKLYDDSQGQPVGTLVSADRVLWQPATAGTSGSPKTGVSADTVKAIVTDPLSAATKVVLDRFGAPTKIIDPYGATTTITRDSASRPSQTIEPNGHTVTYTYTGYDLTQVADAPSGRTVTYGYTNHDLTSISGDVVAHTLAYYNGSNGGPARALRAVYRLGTAIETHKPNALGQDTAVVDAAGHTTRYVYDGTWKNLVQVSDPDHNITTFHLDAAGRTDSTYAPRGITTGVAFGSVGQVTQARNPLGWLTTFQHDSMLSVVRVVAPNNVVHKYRYNALGALTVVHDAADSALADSSGFDLGGNLRRVRTREGVTFPPRTGQGRIGGS